VLAAGGKLREKRLQLEWDLARLVLVAREVLSEALVSTRARIAAHALTHTHARAHVNLLRDGEQKRAELWRHEEQLQVRVEVARRALIEQPNQLRAAPRASRARLPAHARV
jgi:hypothetical protein